MAARAASEAEGAASESHREKQEVDVVGRSVEFCMSRASNGVMNCIMAES